jgi:HD superfamily phosphohydrolase
VSQINKLKIFNDPIYGFITIPNALIYDLIQHPYFQRLRRISQMGLSIWFIRCQSYPFSSRFGLYASDAKAVVVLRFKGVAISVEEENALYIAILLHDIGHGPFTHAMVLLKMYITRKSRCLCIS